MRSHGYCNFPRQGLSRIVRHLYTYTYTYTHNTHNTNVFPASLNGQDSPLSPGRTGIDTRVGKHTTVAERSNAEVSSAFIFGCASSNLACGIFSSDSEMAITWVFETRVQGSIPCRSSSVFLSGAARSTALDLRSKGIHVPSRVRITA